MPLAPGTKLGPYEIVAPLGAGGMGEVYQARDSRLDRTVAVKLIPARLSQDPELRKRLDKEARAISKLSHPNICTLHDIGHQDGTDFLILEYVEGNTLRESILPSILRSRAAVELENMGLRHQIGVLQRSAARRPKLTSGDCSFWICLSRLWRD